MLKAIGATCVVMLLALCGSTSGQQQPFPNLEELKKQFPDQGFFFTVDIDLDADGSGTLKLSYPSNPVMNPGTERDRFTSPVTEMKSVEFNGPMVRTTVAFSDLTRVSEAPELRSITAKRARLEDGRERVEARLRSYITGTVTTQAPLTITVNFPGAVVEANTKDIKGATATWRPPAADFFKDQGILLEAVYRPTEAASATRPN